MTIEREIWAMAKAAAEWAWGRYMQVIDVRLYFWFIPCEGPDGKWGRLLIYADNDTREAGAELVCPEHIPRDRDVSGLMQWFHHRMGMLPIIGKTSRGMRADGGES